MSWVYGEYRDMATNECALGCEGRWVPAMRSEPGHFYRTPRGRLVQVTEVPPHGRKVCIRYWGMYGLGWQSMWLPGDAPLIPAPDVTDFPDPRTAEDALLGVPSNKDVSYG